MSKRWAMNGMVSGGIALSEYVSDALLLDVAIDDGRAPKPPKSAFKNFAPADRPTTDPALAGWMLVVADDAEGREIEKALADLVKHRIRVRDAKRTPVRTPDDVIRRYPGGMDALTLRKWIANNLVLKDRDDVTIRPFYTLIAGSPDKLPFYFEHHIHAGGNAVGRLSFANVSDYAEYAKKVLAFEPEEDALDAERSKVPFGVFATDHGYRDATYQSRKNLVEPIVKPFLKRSKGGSTTTRIANEAEAEALLGMLRGESSDFNGPRLLFSATHGLAVPGDDEESKQLRRARQGAICCQQAKYLRQEIVAADALGDGKLLHGGIWLLFACFGAGTPERSNFFQAAGADSSLLGFHDGGPFVAALPTRLLANPTGPLAVIGHVDPGFVNSFMDENNEILTLRQTGLEASIRFLLRGLRAGAAMDTVVSSMNDFSNQIHAFYSELSASVSSKPGGASRLEIEQKLAEAGDADLEAMRNSLIDSSIAYHDFRNFIILGDPAVRIPPEGFEPSSETMSFGGLAPAPANAGDEPEPRAAPALPEIVAKAEAEKRLVLAESQELFSDQGVKLVSEGETVILLVAGTCHDVRELPSEEEGASADGKKVTFYEAAEHQDCDLLAEIRISATEARPARQVPLPCANGVYLRYGEALSMFGDFYSIPGVRLGDGEAAFRKVFETFDHGDAKEMARIGAAMATERKAVDASLQKTGSATSGYEKVSNDMDKMYNRATGGGQLHGLFPKGRFLQLAEVNYDHFCFDAVAAYRSGHAAACAEARKAARGQSVPERRKRLLVAYLMNACADHYLTDLFASGHLRVPRRELSEQFTPSLTGNLLARRMHNEDNACGLEVRNARGDVWMAFGDKYFHAPQHVKGRQIAREAVAVSAREVWLAFDGQATPDFGALKLVPDVADALVNKANHAAMFIVVKGVLQVRKRRFDLDCYEWTSDMSGVSDLVWATIKESV